MYLIRIFTGFMVFSEWIGSKGFYWVIKDDVNFYLEEKLGILMIHAI